MAWLQAVCLTICSLLTIISSNCNRSDTKYDYKYYPTIKLPVIQLSDSKNINDMILKSMVFDESMKNYSIVILELDNIESQKTFDLTFEAVTNFYKNTSYGYRNNFVRYGSYYPFGKEQYSLKRQMMQQLMANVAKTDMDHFNSTQKAEPLDSYYVFQKQQQFKFDFNNKYLEQIPIEFREESVDIFYEFHSIFKKALFLTSMALGFNYNVFTNDEQLLFDQYSCSLKYAHYLKLHGINKTDGIYDSRLDICNFPYRYGTHFDVGVYTMQRMDHTMQGFQVFINNQWYNVDANDYNANCILIINGKQMEYWTNGYWKASTHRVMSEYEARISLLFFAQPSTDIVIQPIHHCNVCKNHNSGSLYNHVYGKTINQLLEELKRNKTGMI